MKKIIISIISIFIFGNCFSQSLPELKLTPNGVEPIVVSVDSVESSELYKKTLNWILETYKSPDLVIKAKIENEKIRIEAFKQNAWYAKSLGMKYYLDMDYTLEISFKDGKYRFKYTVGQFWAGGQRCLYDYGYFFKSSGEVRSSYSESVPSLEKTMNDLSLNYYNYIIGKSTNLDNKW